MTKRELEELLVKADDIRRSVAKLIKEERKSDRQNGPAEGQEYWYALISHANSYAYSADGFDLDLCEYHDPYPEKRFADAEIRARRLIRAVNKRRRELNDGKEFGDRKYYIVFGIGSGLEAWEGSSPLYSRVNAYPFGLFKDISDCKRCIHEFEGELEWFYTDYMPLMAELDDYDWANAPGWGEEE